MQVDLSQPWAAFPSSFLDSASTYMMAPSMIAAGAAGSTHPVGTGPFVFSNWTQNSSLTVNRNPHYWGGLDGAGHVQQGTPYLDSIQFKVITDDNTRSEALQSGGIDMLTTISAHTANSLASGFNEVKDWDGGSVFVQPNTSPTVNGKPNPMANLHARLAVAYATDAKSVADLAGKGLNLATSPFGPNTPWGMPASQNGYVSYDLAKAKAEVASYEQDTGATSLDHHAHGAAQHRRGHHPAGAQRPVGQGRHHHPHPDPGSVGPDHRHRHRQLPDHLHQQLRLPRPGQRLLLLGLELDQAAAGDQHQLRPLRHRRRSTPT